jgi:hypothetical protein
VILFVVPPNFRVSYEKRRALATGNVVETCTLLAEYRLARGTLFLLVGALAAAGASSLCTSGKGHVSRMPGILRDYNSIVNRICKVLINR